MPELGAIKIIFDMVIAVLIFFSFKKIFRKRKLEVLVYRQPGNGCRDIDPSKNWDQIFLYVEIKNTTSKPIVIKEIKYGSDDWTYVHERTVTLYPRCDAKDGEKWKYLSIKEGTDVRCCKNGGVLVKDINNKKHKSKYVSTRYLTI